MAVNRAGKVFISYRRGDDPGYTLPDGSELYFHRSIQQYKDFNIDSVVYEFWGQHWMRYLTFIRPWLLLLAAPGFLFILVYALLWVIVGFRAAGSRS